MFRIIVPLIFFAGEVLAHPGHDAPSVHVHEWDLLRWALLAAIATIAGIAAWRAK
jgi:hypothetical protein